MSEVDQPLARQPAEITLSLSEGRLVLAAIAGALGNSASADDLRRATQVLVPKLRVLLERAESGSPRRRSR